VPARLAATGVRLQLAQRAPASSDPPPTASDATPAPPDAVDADAGPQPLDSDDPRETSPEPSSPGDDPGHAAPVGDTPGDEPPHHAGAAHGKDDHGSHGVHTIMKIVSGVIALVGIGLAWFFHLHNRKAADEVAWRFPAAVKTLERKYYVDEIYDTLIVKPLHLFGQFLFVLDRLVIEGLASLVGSLPRWVGAGLRPTQHGVLQGYGLGMLGGAAALVLLVYLLVT